MHPRTMQIHAHTAYTQWLSLEPWDLFLTMTDHTICHPEKMVKRTRHAMHLINKSLYGNNYRRRGKGIEYVIGIERQKRFSAHSHTIIRFPDHDVRDPNQFPLGYWHKTINELGGRAKLELPLNSLAICDYVTKYVCKEGELYFSETFNPAMPKAFSHTLLGTVL